MGAAATRLRHTGGMNFAAVDGLRQRGGVSAARLSLVDPLEGGFDVVAERECDLRGALDDSRRARHRGYRLEACDDLAVRGPGCEGESYSVLE